MKLHMYRDLSKAWSPYRWVHLLNHPDVYQATAWIFLTYEYNGMGLASNCSNGRAGHHNLLFASDNRDSMPLARLNHVEIYWPAVLLGLLNTPHVRQNTLNWIRECR